MGSMRLGSQNTTAPTPACTNDSSKPQKFSTRNKTNASPSLLKKNINNNNNDNYDHNYNGKNHSDETTTSARQKAARATTRERGQAILRTTKIPAKKPPHITTISTTRNTSGGSSGSRSVSGNTTSSITALTPTVPTLSIPTLSVPPPLAVHTTNPSTDENGSSLASSLSLSPSPSPPIPTPIPIIITTSATTTTIETATKATRSRSRPRPLPLTPRATRRSLPLKLRDQNVAPVLAPVLKENRKMGHETSLNLSTTNSPNAIATTTTTTATNHTQPQMPSLSAAAARGMNRAPLTPKIASVSRPSQPQTPSLATANGTTTPLPRRTQQRPVSTIVATTSSSNFVPYDDPTTFSPHLNSNVTPRSGSRQSRVDSANSTPNGTPSHNRSDSWDARSGFPFTSPLNHGDPSRKPLVTFSAISPERNLSRKQDAANLRDSKFFHASDAKTSRPASASKMVSPKNPTFFYANGNGITGKSASPTTLSPPLSPGSNWSQENVASKFMYANGTPELRPTPPPTVSHGSGAPVATTSKGSSGRSSAASTRPASPSKLPLHSPTYRNSTGSQAAVASAAAAIALPTRVPVSPPPPLSSAPALRRSGTGTSRSSGHSRSGSLAKVEAIPDPSKPVASPTTGLFPPVNLSPTNPPPLTLASIIQAAEEFTEAQAENDALPDEQSLLQSPSKSTTSSVDPVTDLIANARRERKVQDLQIRNTSLEAINRTLERQLRKQTAELRSYRRLSRSGHLSLASTTVSSRVTSGTMSELELASSPLSDLSEEEVSTEHVEEESFSDSDSAASDVSSSVRAERDAKHRHRDEERLKLDLSKHQQILVDSQKINQSIKRCLDWTEELIKDGKKALEYKVRVSDIQLGGRVLDPLDDEEDNSRLLPSDSTAALDLRPIEEILEKATVWGAEPQDRDSGIELPKDGD